MALGLVPRSQSQSGIGRWIRTPKRKKKRIKIHVRFAKIISLETSAPSRLKQAFTGVVDCGESPSMPAFLGGLIPRTSGEFHVRPNHYKGLVGLCARDPFFLLGASRVDGITR